MPEQTAETAQVLRERSACLQEHCANWDGHGCPCVVLDMEPVDVRAQAHDFYADDDEPTCDHPAAAVLSEVDGTHWCTRCDDEWWEDPL
jgi:hypothetical protein